MVTANRLRDVRQQKGMAQKGLSAHSGVSTATLSAVEKWGYLPTQLTREKIAEALNVPAEAIWPATEQRERREAGR
jgi:DNA-binding XRE family transcriptional regulator